MSFLDVMIPLVILYHAQLEPVSAQSASTCEMSTGGPSTPTNMLITKELVVSSPRPAPNPRPSVQTPPSISPLALPFPSPRPDTTVLHICTSRKRMLDEFQINSDSQLELDTL
ncbi:hypothetical protein BDR04DRAFT_1100762, partial [Suillus decipiens]